MKGLSSHATPVSPEMVELACNMLYGEDWLCDGDEGHNGLINDRLREEMRVVLAAAIEMLPPNRSSERC